MNMTLNIVAPELVGALNSLATAIGANGNPLSGVSVNTDSKVFTADKKVEEPKQPVPELEEEAVAPKTMYFKHEGTGDPVVVKKGESLDFLNKDIFDEITKAEYTALIAEQKKEEPAPAPDPEPVQEEPKEEENTSGISIDILTTKTREFIQSNKANRPKLKAFLESKNVAKVSELPASEYASALAFLEGTE